MIDREKVIKGLESLHTRLLDVAMQDSVVMLDVSMVANAIALLKEQDAKMVVVQDDGCTCCPTCGNELYSWPTQKYCDECGQAVKWE